MRYLAEEIPDEDIQIQVKNFEMEMEADLEEIVEEVEDEEEREKTKEIIRASSTLHHHHDNTSGEGSIVVHADGKTMHVAPYSEAYEAQKQYMKALHQLNDIVMHLDGAVVVEDTLQEISQNMLMWVQAVTEVSSEHALKKKKKKGSSIEPSDAHDEEDDDDDDDDEDEYNVRKLSIQKENFLHMWSVINQVVRELLSVATSKGEMFVEKSKYDAFLLELLKTKNLKNTFVMGIKVILSGSCCCNCFCVHGVDCCSCYRYCCCCFSLSLFSILKI